MIHPPKQDESQISVHGNPRDSGFESDALTGHMPFRPAFECCFEPNLPFCEQSTRNGYRILGGVFGIGKTIAISLMNRAELEPPTFSVSAKCFDILNIEDQLYQRLPFLSAQPTSGADQYIAARTLADQLDDPVAFKLDNFKAKVFTVEFCDLFDPFGIDDAAKRRGLGVLRFCHVTSLL